MNTSLASDVDVITADEWRECAVLQCVTSAKGERVSGTTMTVRLSDAEKALIADYASTFGLSVSEFVRSAALERIEDELDLEVWDRAKAEFDADPVVRSAADGSAKYL